MKWPAPRERAGRWQVRSCQFVLTVTGVTVTVSAPLVFRSMAVTVAPSAKAVPLLLSVQVQPKVAGADPVTS